MVVVLEVGSWLVSFSQSCQGSALFLRSEFLHTSLHQPVCVREWVGLYWSCNVLVKTKKRKTGALSETIIIEPTPFQRGLLLQIQTPPTQGDTSLITTYNTIYKIHLHTKLNTVTIEKKPGSLNSEATHTTHCHNILNDIPHHQRQLIILSFLIIKKHFCRCMFGKTTLNMYQEKIQHKQIQWFSEFF